MSYLELPSQERLQEMFSYDPEVGLFVRRVRTSKSTHIGDIAGATTKNGYISISIGKVFYLAHRLAWKYVYGADPALFIDHMDGDRANNRITNLREVTKSENSRNMRKALCSNKSTGLIGAYLHKGASKFHSQIKVNDEVVYLGQFDSAQEAHEAYVQAKRKHHKTCTI
jgi:hypothetical protein